VIAIVGILSALLLPALKTAKDTAKTIACANNLKQNNLAYLNYAYENNEWTVYDSFELRWENPLVKLNYLPNSYHSETLNNWGWFLSNTMLCPALPEPIAMSSSKPLAYRSDYGLNYLTCHAWNSSLGKYTSGKLQKIIPQAVILGDRYNYPKAEQTPQKGPNPLINPYYSVSYILGIHHSNGANLSFMDAHVEFVKKNAELQHPEWWEKYK
jgi:prepilin-type processing-associated H-X9-DG protein